MPSLLDAPGGLLGLGDPPPPAAQPDLTDALARLLRNPVGTETTQSMGQQTPIDPIAYMGRDGTPIMNSDLARAHQELQQAYQTAPTMALGMMGSTEPGFRAFHGSPYDFSAFDTSKIGTGEGAQAYGHGLYMAGNEATAQTYKFANQPAYMNTATANVAQDAYQQAVKSGATDPLAAARNSLWEQRQTETDPIARRRIDDAYNNIEQLTQPGGAGHMYEVNIGADPNSMLQWDQTVGQHPPAVRDKLLDMGYGDTDRGADIYSHMSRGPAGDVGASQRLQDAGIPGISYLDAGSRGSGQGTKNHVIFDASTIDILRKYGIAALIAGGGATAATQRPQQ